jgi:hypothetical protein
MRERSEAARILEAGLLGTPAAVEATLSFRADRQLLVGSTAVFGCRAGEVAVMEEDTCSNPRPPKALSKQGSEGVFLRLAGLHGPDVVIGGLGLGFGPGEHASGASDTPSAVFQVTPAALTGVPRACRGPIGATGVTAGMPPQRSSACCWPRIRLPRHSSPARPPSPTISTGWRRTINRPWKEASQ